MAAAVTVAASDLAAASIAIAAASSTAAASPTAVASTLVPAPVPAVATLGPSRARHTERRIGHTRPACGRHRSPQRTSAHEARLPDSVASRSAVVGTARSILELAFRDWRDDELCHRDRGEIHGEIVIS